MWTLLQIELYKIFRRPRTYIAFAAITIYDLSGRAIWSNRFLGGDTPFAVTIDISAFKQGIYMVNLETADVNYSAPFVVVR